MPTLRAGEWSSSVWFGKKLLLPSGKSEFLRTRKHAHGGHCMPSSQWTETCGQMSPAQTQPEIKRKEMEWRRQQSAGVQQETAGNSEPELDSEVRQANPVHCRALYEAFTQWLLACWLLAMLVSLLGLTGGVISSRLTTCLLTRGPKQRFTAWGARRLCLQSFYFSTGSKGIPRAGGGGGPREAGSGG